jgi:hypothetical protein
MCGCALKSKPASAPARSIILAKPAVANGEPRSLVKTKGESASPSVERLAQRNPPDSIGAERNLLSQTQTHAVRLGTSAASKLIPRLSK